MFSLLSPASKSNIQCLSRSPWLVSHPLLLFHLSSGKLEGHHYMHLNKTTETVANVKDKIETTENVFQVWVHNVGSSPDNL